jgi:hypothetical protein
MPRFSRVLSLLALLTLPSLAAAQTFLNVDAQSTDSNVHVTWMLQEGSHSPGYPEWTGFDVVRRSVGDCGPSVTVNSEPFPRTASNEYFEVPPPGKMYEYRVVFVDANRQPVSIPDCFDCQRFGYATFPAFSAPMVQGTLQDLGWALYVTNCPNMCFGPFYVSGPVMETLRQYAGTGQAVRFWGSASCGTLEGCSLAVDHYELAACGVTPTRRSSWGELKTLYR